MAEVFRCAEVYTSFSPEAWSTVVLRDLSDHGPKGVRSGRWGIRTINSFRNMGDLTPKNLQQLSISQRIAMLTAHGKWNLLVEPQLMTRLESSFGDLSTWKPKSFLQFALFRKISPQELSPSFLRIYRRELVRRFEEFDTNTQLEVLAAEIIQRTSFTARELDQLFTQVSRSLQAETGILRLKPVKEFYRALIYLRATQPTFFFNQAVGIEILLNGQLQRQGLSLDQGGTSGANNPVRPFGPSFESLVRRIDDLYPRQEKLFEFMDASQWGFFDPVDLYYPNLRLVVEWDGPIHYYRRMTPDGALDPGAYILRPIDTIKDQSLRRLGVAVLRWGRHQNHLTETVDIEALIHQTNPGIWESQ